ncbi:Uncharacterised protein [Providencia rustigianii]|uniref:Fimbrial protein n=3 Tax=Morganellaceae TaxID=1903414 RepID=D1P4J6_9GAMM|nr:fimbrial protein [Providencia rustigianii DSM 4541]MTC55540.1 fimbrial protein [Providencia rustigianii]SPY78526.1 Uncharacterised protein [Providencia rustigianii]SUC28160.1 Uncharacterised protein [Providencia rustigianii]VEB74112.1 Uncharacterised protein [Providencia rustigianii]
MNIKKIMTTISLMLCSIDALSAETFRVNLGELKVDNAAHKLPQTAILGNGWKTFDPSSNNELCTASHAGDFTFLPQTSAQTSGISFKDSSGEYPIFKTNIEGIGYVMGIRQQGTSRWYPVTGNNSPINGKEASSGLRLEARMLYVKTSAGSIEHKENESIQFQPVVVQCMGNLDWHNVVGEIQPIPTLVKWAQRTCEIKNANQNVNLGVHNLADIRALQVGQTFGYAQQSITIDCPSQLSVFYGIADNLHLANIDSNIIYLENNKEDPGFAVQIFESGNSTALRLGGDRSLSTSHLYSLVNTARSTQIITKTFDFKYIKTSNDVKATEGNAQVTVTLVYK